MKYWILLMGKWYLAHFREANSQFPIHRKLKGLRTILSYGWLFCWMGWKIHYWDMNVFWRIYRMNVSCGKIVRSYEHQQKVLDCAATNNKTIILGDFNDRVGKIPIVGMKQRFNEKISNGYGERLIEMYLLNILRFSNMNYDHPIPPMVDYVVMIQQIYP